METMNMCQNFDFNSFMKRRGWSSLISMLIGIGLVWGIVSRVFTV